MVSCLFLSIQITTAGTTGKIAGHVVGDEGQGLQGANVILEGTSLGVATDENGFYALLNVPPGHYTLVVSMIGYAKVTVENVFSCYRYYHYNKYYLTT